ncbi:MAG TPA: SpoIIE family protein phosphatase [Blastocatellia bacterium]|nr:SpoIIE family protein phosphatase [Blastocatellia bacterium]
MINDVTRDPIRRRLRLILGATFFALLFVSTGVNMYRGLAVLGRESEPGWAANQIGSLIFIEQLGPDLPPALQVGDEIVSLNEQAVRHTSDIIRAFRNIHPGQPYQIEIRRNGQSRSFTLEAMPILTADWVAMVATYLLIPPIFVITGFIVFLLKPHDRQARLLALMFGMFIGVRAMSPSVLGSDAWLMGVILAVQIASLFLWPVFFHFFLIFPEPSPLLRRFPRLSLYLYAPHLIVIFPFLATLNLLAAYGDEASYLSFVRTFSPLQIVGIYLQVLYVAGGLFSLMTNYRQASRASRRKMRVVVAGSIAGFLPLFLLLVLALLFGSPNTRFAQWLWIIAFFAIPLFPLSFAYAIVRHQVIPIRLILRRGVRYLLVSRGFIIIQAIVVFALLSFLLTGRRMAFIDSLGPRADIAATMLATAIAIGLLTIINHRVLPIIDRKFFREAYDAQQVLSELGQEIRAVPTVGQLLARAVAKIQTALHIETVAIFLRDDQTGNYACSISSRALEDTTFTSDLDRSLVIPGDGFVVERMNHSSQPLVVESDDDGPTGDSGGWRNRPGADAGTKELKTLRRVRSALLLPVATKDELLGIISLGPRLGDLPYSREDRNLLMALAWQIAFALQNAQLVQQISEEERLRHELEIATSVQQRLFPQNPPDLGRVELSGVCHPARGVGGDYYDFILLGPGRVGIAVADVAGKGISAALLMSTVQASLRSQAPSVNGNLTGLVASMNRLLHVSTDASAYATFFYAQYDEATRMLTYVNAGHNPPLLVRAAARAQEARARAAAGNVKSLKAEIKAEPERPDISLLSTGGPIIGAFDTSDYEQETVAMYEDDLLVAYTDGVTEALNPDGEEFGEARLRQVIAAGAELSAHELTLNIVEAVREFCRDMPQQDDLTLVVMKVK